MATNRLDLLSLPLAMFLQLAFLFVQLHCSDLFFSIPFFEVSEISLTFDQQVF